MARQSLALLAAVPLVVAAAPAPPPQPRFLSLRGNTLVVTRFHARSTRIQLPKVASTSSSSTVVSWIRSGARAAVFRATGTDRGSLDVVNVRTHGIRTHTVSGSGAAAADAVAVADDGRIAFLHTLPAHDPPLCGTADKFRLYAVDAAFAKVIELRILPPDFNLEAKARVFVDALAWSSHGMLSYVIGKCAGAPGDRGRADSVVVTRAEAGAVPRRVAAIGGERSYATAWSPDGQRIALAYTEFRKGKPVTFVEVATLSGAVKRVAAPATRGSYVHLDWSTATPILYTMDNGFADLTEINVRAHRARRLWLPKGNWPERPADISHDGRFVGLGGVVLDIKAHRRWHVRWPRDAADFTLG